MRKTNSPQYSAVRYNCVQYSAVQAQDGAREEEELSVHVSPLLVIFFVLCMCSMLVLLYFFFDQLVYVIMTMFCIASSLAMYSCLEPIVMASYQVNHLLKNPPSSLLQMSWLPVLRLPRVNLYICILQLELRYCTDVTQEVAVSL